MNFLLLANLKCSLSLFDSKRYQDMRALLLPLLMTLFLNYSQSILVYRSAFKALNALVAALIVLLSFIW